jgi:hypothetical protein
MCLMRTSRSCCVIEDLSGGEDVVAEVFAEAAGRIQVNLAAE